MCSNRYTTCLCYTLQLHCTICSSLTEELKWVSVVSNEGKRSLIAVVEFVDMFVELGVMEQSVSEVMPCVFYHQTSKDLCNNCVPG